MFRAVQFLTATPFSDAVLVSANHLSALRDIYKEYNRANSKMKELIVHQVNIAHYRLIELSKLADQAKPFYDWVEKIAKQITNSHHSLNDILQTVTKKKIVSIIKACYCAKEAERPLLFDGIGRVYPHRDACFYFFAWMIRDAPRQRLSPLISKMKQLDKVSERDAQIDSLANLIVEYRRNVQGFTWTAVREVVMDRLEGSRRSIRGHEVEAYVRTALSIALQNFYASHSNYGQYQYVQVSSKQIKIGNHTVDVSATCVQIDSSVLHIFLPIKTRETEGGGHSHLFSRDIIAAVRDIKDAEPRSVILVVIVADNWSQREIQIMGAHIDRVFHFNMSPNRFVGFDDKRQIELNRFVAEVLGGNANDKIE